MSLATDNVKATSSPNRWNVRDITLASVVIAVPLVLQGILSLIAGRAWFHLDPVRLRAFMLLVLVFTSQFRVYIVRERRWFWSSAPGRALVVTTVAALAVFSLLGLYGIVLARLSPQQLLFALAFSAAVTLAVDWPKHLAFRRFGL